MTEHRKLSNQEIKEAFTDLLRLGMEGFHDLKPKHILQLEDYVNEILHKSTGLAIQLMIDNQNYPMPEEYKNGNEVDYWLSKIDNYQNARLVLTLINNYRNNKAPASQISESENLASNSTTSLSQDEETKIKVDVKLFFAIAKKENLYDKYTEYKIEDVVTKLLFEFENNIIFKNYIFKTEPKTTTLIRYVKTFKSMRPNSEEWANYEKKYKALKNNNLNHF